MRARRAAFVGVRAPPLPADPGQGTEPCSRHHANLFPAGTLLPVPMAGLALQPLPGGSGEGPPSRPGTLPGNFVGLSGERAGWKSGGEGGLGVWEHGRNSPGAGASFSAGCPVEQEHFSGAAGLLPGLLLPSQGSAGAGPHT